MSDTKKQYAAIGIRIDNYRKTIECNHCKFKDSYISTEDIIKLHYENKPDCILFSKKHYRTSEFASFDSLKYEDERLATFVDWLIPEFIVKPEDLAEAGFFNLRKNDGECVCIFCDGVLGDWQRGCIPRQEHEKQFPHCPFILNQPVGNVAMTQCNILKNLSPKPLVPPTNESHHDSYWNMTKSMDRLVTFGSWPICLTQDPNDLVLAGFYYTGISDHVRCYQCGLGFRNWLRENHPMVEHARHNPYCLYVLNTIPTEYLKKIKDKSHYHTNYDISEEALEILLQNDIARALYQNDFSDDEVSDIYRQKLQRTGVPFPSIDSFIAEFEYFKNINKVEQRTNKKWKVLFISCGHAYYPTDKKDIGSNNSCPTCGEKHQKTLVRLLDNQRHGKCRDCGIHAATIRRNFFKNEKEGRKKTNNIWLCVLCCRERVKVTPLFLVKEYSICGLCYDEFDEKKAIMFMPCGHIECCEDCAETAKFCPRCFSFIDNKKMITR